MKYPSRMLGSRTRISLLQFLDLQPVQANALMLEKCGLPPMPTRPGALDASLRSCNVSQLLTLLDEICRSTRMLRAAVNPKYMYDERWEDLARCLLLDGYRIAGDYSKGYEIVAVDPTIEGSIALDDDLSRELARSNLRDREEIARLMKNSAEDFRKQPADFNGSLTSARVSLETLAKNIASVYRSSLPMSGDPSKFGAIIAYLQHQVHFLDDKEEKVIVGVYGFVSAGAHVPVGFSQEEMVRLGRGMIASMCYFLIKKHNG